ncbi:MAG TPA: hypothetical protein VGW39_16500 [Chthoniobacterales bacterium]|nr:hypothetical protein [Chthoniobacterales bacterium]
MKRPLLLLVILILFTFLGDSFAAKSPSEVRTLTDLNVIPVRVLKRSISPQFHQSLLISPVQGWIVVRASLAGTHLSGMRVIRSELNGRYDSLALQRAKEVLIAGNYTIDKPNLGTSVLLHLLIYQIADGTMALSFAHLDEPGGDQADYYGCARLAVLKADGKWTEIKGPPGLHGKGWVIRRAFQNNLEASLKMEPRLPGR